MDQYIAAAIAAVASALLAAGAALLLRLPWWAMLLAAMVAWLGLALQLSLWAVPSGSMLWAAAKLIPLPTLAGGAYAVITRGMIGPPEGPLPRSH